MKPMGHATLQERKNSGAHYTPLNLADFVARQILSVWRPIAKAGQIRILDPAIGDGQLITALVKKLITSGYKEFELLGFDTDVSAIEQAKEKLRCLCPSAALDLRNRNFLDIVRSSQSQDLFSTFAPLKSVDLIIANPPYVRTQVMGASNSKKLAIQFDLSGRVDLYYAFVLSLVEVLDKTGVAGVIVSNRFMTTQSGRSVRKSLLERYDVLHIWDLGDTKLFEAAVLPAVLLLRRKQNMTNGNKTGFTSIYSANVDLFAQSCPDVISALELQGPVKVNGMQSYCVKHGFLNGDISDGAVWRMATDSVDQWLSTVNRNTSLTFGEIGKIRVGVKTTADSVFIRSDWENASGTARPELLRPLLTHHNAYNYRAHPTSKQILYPHIVANGKRVAVDLAKYPNTARYLELHRTALESRSYVMDSGRKWFEIWVPQHPELWSKPKLVFRDIVDKPTFWLDTSGAVVNGDCYWLTLNSTIEEDWLWLALAIGNSAFIEIFYDRNFNNKLYANRRRFMTQYVEKFPLPDIKTPLSQQIVSLAKQIFELTLTTDTSSFKKELDCLIWQAFGVTDQKS